MPELTCGFLPAPPLGQAACGRRSSTRRQRSCPCSGGAGLPRTIPRRTDGCGFACGLPPWRTTFPAEACAGGGRGVNLGDTHARSLAPGSLRRIARPVFLIQFVSTRPACADSGASPHPSRWPSLVIAPHPGQTRCTQQAESPPSAGRLSSCPLLTVSSMEVSRTPVAARRDRSPGRCRRRSSGRCYSNTYWIYCRRDGGRDALAPGGKRDEGRGHRGRGARGRAGQGICGAAAGRGRGRAVAVYGLLTAGVAAVCAGFAASRPVVIAATAAGCWPSPAFAAAASLSARPLRLLVSARRPAMAPGRSARWR